MFLLIIDFFYSLALLSIAVLRYTVYTVASIVENVSLVAAHVSLFDESVTSEQNVS